MDPPGTELMPDTPEWLPDQLDLDGSWDEALAKLYQVFHRDFEAGRPCFSGRPIWWDQRTIDGDRYPEGFWHLISKMSRAEDARIPDYPRARKLPWCSPTLSHPTADPVLTWEYKEGTGALRTYVWLSELDYVIILERQSKRRGDIYRLITAYHIEGDSGRRKLRRRYERRHQ